MATPISKYGCTWAAGTDPLQIEFACIRRMGEWVKDGVKCGAGLFHHFMEARALLWPKRYRHRWTDLMFSNFIANDVTVLLGAACVAGHTRILDPITGAQPTVEHLFKNQIAPMVMTLDGPRQAGIPFVKGTDALLEIRTDNGNTFTCASEHLILTWRGYVPARRLSCGDTILAYEPDPRASRFRVLSARILSIKETHKDVYYDLSVPGPEHYFAEGVIHHNSTQKTSHACEFVLINYFARPDNTLVILSTVNMDKLDIGVWGEVKMLWQDARVRYPWLAGNLIDHKKAITTDNLEEDGIRDMRKGLMGRPCYVGGKWVGLGILAGLKQEYIFYVADELQFMQEAFSASWPHLFSNGNCKVIGSANPKHDPDDEAGKTAEPKNGWNSHPEPDKTEVWDTKFMGAKCVNLVGTDSPNFDVPEGTPEPYPKLIGRKFANRIAQDYGKDSFEYYRLVKGVMRVAFAQSRVITRQLCREHKAFDKPNWKGVERRRVYGLDPTYGGEDRCVGMALEFGEDMSGQQVINIIGYRVYQFKLNIEREVESQLADILDEELKAYGIPSEDCFYDSVGKGTLGGPFALKFGDRPPVAVDSGDQPTKRPVRHDLFVEEDDGFGKVVRRLKRCNEHYSKFVSEMWFSVRYCIEAEQLRGLSQEVMVEGCARIYEMVAGNKIQVEPKSDPRKKEDLKRRLGKSPDLFDTLAIAVEGARQRGFQIKRLGGEVAVENPEPDWLANEGESYQGVIKDCLLK